MCSSFCGRFFDCDKDPDCDFGGGLSYQAIAGCVVAGLACAWIIVGIIMAVCYCRKKRSQPQSDIIKVQPASWETIPDATAFGQANTQSSSPAASPYSAYQQPSTVVTQEFK